MDDALNPDKQTDWIEPLKGYQYGTRQMTVEAADQKRLIELCGIDASLFGSDMDPSGFISLAIQEGVRNRIHANGTVNMANRLHQHRRMTLDEPLTVTGRILDVVEVPRGKVAMSETWFSGADGKRAITSWRNSLRPDPAKVGTRGAGEKPQPVVQDMAALKKVAQYTLTPEGVKAYTGPHNPIHYDPEAAKRGGFRAPIIGGGQGVRFLTAEIWRHYRPNELDIEVFFRRPIFWDDSVDVMVEERDGRWGAICLMKDGKICTEMKINKVA